MTPSRYAKGGEGLVIRYATATEGLGTLLVAATDRGLCAALLGRSASEVERALEREFPHADLRHVARSAAAVRELFGHVAGRLSGFEGSDPLPLDLIGTAFQRTVWQALLEIPRGATRSYAEIARAIGRPTATRAVARAIASNRVAAVVPCHRVVRGDGSVGGYRWGEDRKRRLLAAEQAPASSEARGQ
jgi:AraC family transcriptional regulator of adaptative response/methylated-DNA-[protein]-cysteine methyltransferase